MQLTSDIIKQHVKSSRNFNWNKNWTLQPVTEHSVPVEDGTFELFPDEDHPQFKLQQSVYQVNQTIAEGPHSGNQPAGMLIAWHRNDELRKLQFIAITGKTHKWTSKFGLLHTPHVPKEKSNEQAAA